MRKTNSWKADASVLMLRNATKAQNSIKLTGELVVIKKYGCSLRCRRKYKTMCRRVHRPVLSAFLGECSSTCRDRIQTCPPLGRCPLRWYYTATRTWASSPFVRLAMGPLQSFRGLSPTEAGARVGVKIVRLSMELNSNLKSSSKCEAHGIR